MTVFGPPGAQNFKFYIKTNHFNGWVGARGGPTSPLVPGADWDIVWPGWRRVGVGWWVFRRPASGF